MKRFHQWLIGISLMGMLASGIASASFSGGGGGGLSITEIIAGITGIFAKLDVENTFTEGQLMHKTDSTVGGERRGLEIRNNEAGSLCLGPSDGSTKSFCLTNSGGLGKLEGQLGDLYGTATAASTGFAFDSLSNGRMSIAPSGVTSIGAATTTAANVTLTVGSNTEAAATFAVDATNDWTKQLPIAAPAATECDDAAEKGRLYFDSTENTYKGCDGENWSSSARNHIYRLDSASTTTFYTDSKASFTYDSAGDLDINVTTLPAGNFYSHSCFNHSSQDEASRNTTGTEELWGTFSHGVHVVCNVAANNDPTWPTYYIEAYHTGSGDDVIINLRVF